MEKFYIIFRDDSNDCDGVDYEVLGTTTDIKIAERFRQAFNNVWFQEDNSIKNENLFKKVLKGLNYYSVSINKNNKRMYCDKEGLNSDHNYKEYSFSNREYYVTKCWAKSAEGAKKIAMDKFEKYIEEDDEETIPRF